MNVYEFLTHLRTLDIQVNVDGDRLRINAPAGTVTPEIKAELNSRKSEIISLLSNGDAIPTVPRGGPLPLSPAQEHLWQLHRLSPDTAAYNMYAVFRLLGLLDIQALASAIRNVVARHKVLRTAFPKSADGTPEATISLASSIGIRHVNLSPSTSTQAELQSIIEKEVRQPFDLISGPLFRPTLVRIQPTEHILILVIHHIISDGHSFAVLYDDLECAYRAACTGNPVDWLPLPLQYADIAAWQRSWLASDASASDRKYWRSHLAGKVPVLELPFDHPHPLHTVAEGDYVDIRIQPNLPAALQEFCQQEGLTVFTVVLAAFNLLLHRRSGQEDLVVCTPVAARERIEFGHLIGYFNNTLLLRTDLTKAGTIRGLLHQTQEMVMNALAHQMFPFMEVASFPNLAYTPLSRAMVVVLDPTDDILQLPGLDIEKIPVFSKAVQYDLALEMAVSSNQLDGRLMYRKVLFERTTVENLASEFRLILEEIVVHVDQPISQGMYARPVTKPETLEAAKLPYTAPRNDLERRLAQIWQEVLKVEKVGVQDEFFELGGHSLLALRLFTRIEQETGSRLPLSTLFQTTTIAHLAHLIETGNVDTSQECFIPIQPRGTKAPFFCIHGVEGGVLGYSDLADALGEDQPVLGLQAVGLDGGEQYDTSVEAMASRYIDVMRSHQPHGPYRIGGYCFGGVVAYEMACQLEKMGQQVSLVAIFEGAMPDTMDHHESIGRRLDLIRKSIPVWVKDYSNMSPHQLFKRFRSTFTKIRSKLQRDPEVERRVRVEETLDIDTNNLPSRHIELTDVCLKAALKYVPAEYHGVVTLFRARNRSFNEVVFGSIDPKMGWGRLAKGGVKVRMVDGFHRNMHLAPYASSLGAELKKFLDEKSEGRDLSGV